MATVFDAKTTSDLSATSAVGVSGTPLTISSLPNRALVVGVIWSGTPTGVVVTWDLGGINQNVPFIDSVPCGAAAIANLYGLVAPTSGNKTLSITWSNSLNVVASAICFTGVNQTGGTTTFSSDTLGTGTGNTSTLGVITSINDAVVAIHGSDSTTQTILSVNNNQISVDNSVANLHFGANYEVNGSSVSMNAAFSGSVSWGVLGINVVGIVLPILLMPQRAIT